VRLAPGVAVRLVVTNLLVGRQPLYALGEWAAPFAPDLLGLAEGEIDAVNDDRVGRALEALFDADRASLLTELILGVVAEFEVETTELHNDSTSISVQGLYPGADGRARGRVQELGGHHRAVARRPHGRGRRGGAPVNEISDLRATYGWRLCLHARDVARARGVGAREVLEAIQQPEIVHTAFNYGPDRYVYKRRDLAVVVAPASKVVITVLWNTPTNWTNEEFCLARSRGESAARHSGNAVVPAALHPLA